MTTDQAEGRNAAGKRVPEKTIKVRIGLVYRLGEPKAGPAQDLELDRGGEESGRMPQAAVYEIEEPLGAGGQHADAGHWPRQGPGQTPGTTPKAVVRVS